MMRIELKINTLLTFDLFFYAPPPDFKLASSVNYTQQVMKSCTSDEKTPILAVNASNKLLISQFFKNYV